MDPTQPAAFSTSSHDRSADSAGGDAVAVRETTSEQLSELRRMNAELDARLRRQAEQLQQLEQQRDQIALQTRQFQARGGGRQKSGRLGVLLALLALTGVAAVGFHTWPQLQYVAGDLKRVNSDVVQLEPRLESVSGKVSSLTSDMEQMDSTVASLRVDVSGVRSDLRALGPVATNLPERKDSVRTGTAGKRRAYGTVTRKAIAVRYPYRAMYPSRPW